MGCEIRVSGDVTNAFCDRICGTPKKTPKKWVPLLSPSPRAQDLSGSKKTRTKRRVFVVWQSQLEMEKISNFHTEPFLGQSLVM